MKRCAGWFFIYLLMLIFSGSSVVFAQQLLNNGSLAVAATNQTNHTLADIISLSAERPILMELLTQSGILPTLSADNSYTFFAPSEEALKELQYESAEKLQIIMQHHIVPGRYKLADLRDGTKLPTLAGDSITVFRKMKEVLVNSIPIRSSNEKARNGVMHTIEDILKPKNLD